MNNQTLAQQVKALGEQRGEKIAKIKALADVAAQRALTPEEEKQYNDLKAEAESINKRMEILREEEVRAAAAAVPYVQTGASASASKQDERDINSYSMLKVVQRAITQKPLDGIEAEMAQEAAKEARESGTAIQGYGIPMVVLQRKKIATSINRRDLTATGTTSTAGDQGGDLVQTTKMSFIDILRNRMVLAGLGTQFLTGLQGNISMPRKTSGVTGDHKGETTASDEGTILFDSVDLSPKRLPFWVQYSKQLVLQSSQAVEQMVTNDVLRGLSVKMEYFAINGSGLSNQPTGILNTGSIGSVVGGTDGAAPDFDDIIDLEREVSIDNADLGSLAYLTNAKVRGKLKKTKIDSGSGIFVWGQGANELNGYNTAVTNNVPSNLDKGTSTGVCSAIIFGNFNDLVIGQWGGMDVVVDPYTDAKSGLINLTSALYYDVAVRHPESFAAMKDATTA